MDTAYNCKVPENMLEFIPFLADIREGLAEEMAKEALKGDLPWPHAT